MAFTVVHKMPRYLLIYHKIYRLEPFIVLQSTKILLSNIAVVILDFSLLLLVKLLLLFFFASFLVYFFAIAKSFPLLFAIAFRIKKSENYLYRDTESNTEKKSGINAQNRYKKIKVIKSDIFCNRKL